MSFLIIRICTGCGVEFRCKSQSRKMHCTKECYDNPHFRINRANAINSKHYLSENEELKFNILWILKKHNLIPQDS